MSEPTAGPPSPISVLFVIDGLWVGGAERSLAELLPALTERGIHPTVACFRHREEGVEHEVLDQGITVRFLDVDGYRRQIVALRRLLRELRPRIVHSTLFRSNLVTRLAAIGLPVLVVSSLTNTMYSRARAADPNVKRWRALILKLIDRLTGRTLVDHFHAVSEAARDEAEQVLGIPRAKITVARRGRDPRRLGEPSEARRVRVRQQLGIGPSADVLLNFGRHEYQKAQDDLLEAMAILATRRPSTVLLIAGRSGHATPRLHEIHRQHGLGDRVVFLGHRDDIGDLLCAADVFVFPSLYEGLPGSLIEAMAMGVPIVCSDILPNREVVEKGRTALIVAPRSPEDLARIVEGLLRDPERRAAMGVEAREEFMARYTIGRSAEQLSALFLALSELT